jgi:hypothetical protein
LNIWESKVEPTVKKNLYGEKKNARHTKEKIRKGYKGENTFSWTLKYLRLGVFVQFTIKMTFDYRSLKRH